MVVESARVTTRIRAVRGSTWDSKLGAFDCLWRFFNSVESAIEAGDYTRFQSVTAIFLLPRMSNGVSGRGSSLRGVATVWYSKATRCEA